MKINFNTDDGRTLMYFGYDSGGYNNVDYFYDVLKELRRKANSFVMEWNGDYMVTTYKVGEETYKYWFNAELGVPTLIEKA